MLSPEKILSWLKENVKDRWLSRLKTLAAMVPAATQLEGVDERYGQACTLYACRRR